MVSNKESDEAIARDGMIGAIPVNPKLSERLEMDSDADDLIKLREEASEQFNLDELKEKYKKIILKSKEFRGDKTLTEADAELVAQNRIDKFYEFKPISNPDSFSTKCARGYVNIYKNRRKYGLSILSAASLAGLLWVSSVAVNSWRLWSAEKSVETAVEENYRVRESLINQINSLDSNKSLLKDADELVALIRISGDELNRTNDFFSKYSNEGVADDKITSQNYAEAKQNLQSVEEILASVKQKVNTGEGLVRFEQDLISTRQSLDSLIKEIESSTPPKVLMTRASAVYNSGVASLDSRQLDQARQYKEQLTEVKNNVKEFETLPSALEQLYSSIKQIAKETSAVQKADTLHNNGLTYVTNVDVKSLKATISGLDELNTVLKQEFKINIVQKPMSGFLRDYTDQHGTVQSGAYIVVEAIDSNGDVIKRRITNEEDGRVYSVARWAERVPDAVLEEVKKDKSDGIVNNNLFAEKKVGYLSEELIMSGITKRGQITSW